MPPPQHSLGQPNIHGPALHPPHRPIPCGPPPQFLSQQFQTIEDGYQTNEENWHLADEIIADMERADQGQLSSPGGKHSVAYAGGAQSGPISPPKDTPLQRLVRNNLERVSPKHFIENAQTGANTRKPRDRTSQSSIPSIPSNGGSPLFSGSCPHPFRPAISRDDLVSFQLDKVIQFHSPLQSVNAKSPDRSLPLQEEPEDHQDDSGLLQLVPLPLLREFARRSARL